MLAGECLGLDGTDCSGDVDRKHPTVKLPLRVCHSGGGYYLGYWCPVCGPISRESHYYPDLKSAQYDLEHDPSARSRLHPA